jgi:hypothetical protein
MMTGRHGEHLPGWIDAAGPGDLPCLHSFTRGIRRDQAAVTNGLTLAHSSGAAEGHVTLKPSNARCPAAPTSTCCERGSCSARNTTQSHRVTIFVPEPEICPLAAIKSGPWPLLRVFIVIGMPGNGQGRRSRGSGLRSGTRGLRGDVDACQLPAGGAGGAANAALAGVLGDRCRFGRAEQGNDDVPVTPVHQGVPADGGRGMAWIGDPISVSTPSTRGGGWRARGRKFTRQA